MSRRLRIGLPHSQLALILLIGGLAAPAQAQTPLVEEARAARADYQSVQQEDVEETEQRLRATMREVETFLSRGPADFAQGWRRYLRWEALQQQLGREESPDLEILNETLIRLYQDRVGLERRQFRDLRDALRDYMNSVLFSTAPNVEQSYQTQIDELIRRLERTTEQPQEDDSEAIGQILNFLERSGQARGLVRRLRERFYSPNIYAQISQRLIDDGFRETVNQVVPVNDCILGTAIRGTARTTGTVSIDLVPNPEIATFDIQLRGQAISDNVGFNGPVTIYSDGLTAINAATRLVIHPTGLYAGPADAVCRTDSMIEAIAARFRLIEHVAWKRAQQSQPQAERIASQRAEARVEQQLNEETVEVLRQVNERYREAFRYPLLRRGAFPEILRFTTTERSVEVEALQASRFQLAAPGPAPALADDYDMSLRFHESAVANTSEALLAGKTMTDERLAELVEAVTGEVPEELRVTPEKDPWSITFAASQPIKAGFSGNTLRLAIRGRQFTRGSDQINYTIEISAVYELQREGSGARLVRQGPPEVTYLNLTRLSTKEIIFKTFLENKFSALFQPEIHTTGLELPGRWSAAGKLRLAKLEAEQGWLTAAWQRGR